MYNKKKQDNVCYQSIKIFLQNIKKIYNNNNDDYV